MKYFLWFLTVSLFLPVSIFAVDVSITADVEETTVEFTYMFQFMDEQDYSSFAFETPRDSIFISSTTTSGENITPQIAGDFFLISPDKTRGENITVVFEAPYTFETLMNENTFSVYTAFTLDTVNLDFTYDSGEVFQREIVEIFPRDYREEDGIIFWNLEEVSTEQLFLVSYQGEGGTESSDEFIFLLLLLIPVLFFVILLIFLLFSSKDKKEVNKDVTSDENEIELNNKKDKNKEVELDKSSVVEDNKEVETTTDDKETENKQTFEEYREDYIIKYLTNNEQKVVNVVRKMEGIPQNDILDYLTGLTKSNLSKIVTKLHGKRVLSRIRVGKTNKIYLGEKLKEDNFDKNQG